MTPIIGWSHMLQLQDHMIEKKVIKDFEIDDII